MVSDGTGGYVMITMMILAVTVMVYGDFDYGCGAYGGFDACLR